MLPIFARAAAIAARRQPEDFDISLEADVSQLETLDQKVKALGKNNPHIRAGLNKVGVRFVANIKANFRKSQDPYGKQWKKLKYRDGQPLIDTGALRNSIKYDLWGTKVRLMSRLDYAGYHNNGRGVPKRRFTPDNRGLPAKWQKQYDKIMLEHVEKALK